MGVEPEDAEPTIVIMIELGDDGEFSSAVCTQIVNRRCRVRQDIRERSGMGENSAQISHAVMNLVVTGEWCNHLYCVGDQSTQSRYGTSKPIAAWSTAMMRVEENHLRIVTYYNSLRDSL